MHCNTMTLNILFHKVLYFSDTLYILYCKVLNINDHIVIILKEKTNGLEMERNCNENNSSICPFFLRICVVLTITRK
jgi:hypothetical protein